MRKSMNNMNVQVRDYNYEHKKIWTDLSAAFKIFTVPNLISIARLKRSRFQNTVGISHCLR